MDTIGAPYDETPSRDGGAVPGLMFGDLFPTEPVSALYRTMWLGAFEGSNPTALDSPAPGSASTQGATPPQASSRRDPQKFDWTIADPPRDWPYAGPQAIVVPNDDVRAAPQTTDVTDAALPTTAAATDPVPSGAMEPSGSRETHSDAAPPESSHTDGELRFDDLIPDREIDADWPHSPNLGIGSAASEAEAARIAAAARQRNSLIHHKEGALTEAIPEVAFTLATLAAPYAALPLAARLAPRIAGRIIARFVLPQ